MKATRIVLKVSNITINSQQIHEIDENSETKISTLEIDKIYETAEYFFIKLKSNQSVIIPKLKTANVDLLKTELESIADERHILFIEMKNWKWK
ncbi:MAG TPA: YcxB family protein [Parafilimonas sp.]|nr:YcxB family protein [Parafilimonas sp.]